MLTVENSAVRIEMLGGLQVIRPGIIPLNFPPNQAGNLLGLLALHLGASRTREWLTSVLWPGDDPEESRQRLRQSLYLLRQELSAWSPGSESVLVGSRDTIGLDARLVETDARDFEELIKAADCAVDPATQSAHLLAALRLHKGDLLSGFYHECFEAEQRRFEEMYRSTYHTLPLRYEAAADIPRAIEAARAAIRHDPLAEETHCCLMRLYAASGQPTAVLRQYQDLARILRDELNEEPSVETRQLMESLRESGRATLAASARPSLNGRNGQVEPAGATANSGSRTQPWRSRRFAYVALVVVAACVALFWIRGSLLPHASTSSDIPFISVDIPEPRIQWTRVIPLEAGDNWSEPSGIATDSQGDIYVAGFVNTTKTDTDYLTQKISPSGELFWQRRYNGTGNDVDRARGIMVDIDGNIVVTGDSLNRTGSGATKLSGLDIVTVKYDPAGNQKYAVRWNGVSDGEDRPVKIVLDHRTGDAIVIGSSWATTANRGKGGFQTICLRLDRNATERSRPAFATPYLGAGHLEARATDVTVGSNSDVYVVGTAATEAVKGPDEETFGLELSPDGKIVWAHPIGGREAVRDSWPVICGDMIASPDLRPSPHGVTSDILLTRISLSGSELWSIPFSVSAEADDAPVAMSSCYGGDRWIVGRYTEPGGAEHLSVAEYDFHGVRKWARRLRSLSFGRDRPTCVQWVGDSLYIAGYTSVRNSEGAAEDALLVLKLRSHDGEPIWMSRAIPTPRAGGLANTEDVRMALGTDGGPVVTCQVQVNGKGVIEVVKFAP